MGRLLKVVGIALGALVLLVVVAVLAVTLLIDPNDYKDQIAAAVQQATGRELTLEGDLELDLFPTARIGVGRASLGNAEGFDGRPFAEIGGASLDVDLLPLLSRRVEIGEVRLDGLVLNLARDAQGRNNWQDLGGGASEPAADDPDAAGAEDGATGRAADVDLNVDVIRVTDSEVTWTDAANGSEWTLGDFNLEASGFGPDIAFPLVTSFTLASDALRVAVDAEMRATLSLVQNAYRLEDLDVLVAGEGETWPGGEGEARLSFAAFTANLDDETLDLEQLNLELLGVTARGSLEGRQLLSDLTLGGAVEIEPFDPSALLGVFDAAVETADPGVLRTASAAARFVYDSSRIGLEDMRLALDDSTLTGNVEVRGQAVRFDLDVDEINIDRYLPPAAEEDDVGPEDEGSVDEIDLPLDALRTVDASGSLAFGAAQFAGMSLADASFALEARDGRISLAPAASLYGGTLDAEIRLEIGEDAARAALESTLTDVDMMPLGQDLLDSEMVSGRGDLSLNLTTVGSNVGQMRRDLDGDVAFTLSDGAWEGFDLWFELVRARAVLEGESRERPDGPRRTPFSSVSASGVVEDALLTNQDLNATLPFMTVDGQGTVNLITDEIEFDLVATFVDGPALQSEPLMARLAGDQLPLRVGGTVAEPSVAPDFGALVRARVQEQVTERVDEERSEVQEQVEEQRSEVQQQVEEERSEVEQQVEEEREELRDRLRGIFDR